MTRAIVGVERNQPHGGDPRRTMRDTMKRAEPGKNAIAHTVDATAYGTR